MSNAMKFKSTQSSLYPIDKIAKIKTKKSRKNDKQQNAVPIYHCNKPYHEILKDSLINNIYLITAEPSNVQRLATLHFIHGHPRTLEDSCRFLGCYSFNDFIRKQEFIFCEFLEIFVIKTDKKINVTESPFLLNYYNNKIHQNQGLRNSMKEAMDEEPEPDRDRYLITFEQTKYFEFHNSLEYIDGRKKFAKVVEECRLQGLYNRNGYVTLNKFQQFCQKMFNANFSTLLKSWFPRCGGLENIMRKVIFEEIDCSFKSQKKENEFRIKPGCTIDEISQNLDLLKENITQFYYRIERDFSITASESTHQYDRRQRYGSKYKKRKDALTLPKPVENCFASSDEEAVDLRIENRPFVLPNHRRNLYIGNGKNASMAKKDDVQKGIQKPLFEDYNELIGRRRILPDCELDEFVPEFIDADVGYAIVRDALKKDMDQMKDKVDVDVKIDLCNVSENVEIPSLQEQQHDSNLVASSILSKLTKTLDSKIEKSQKSVMDKDATKSTCDNAQIDALITEFDSLHLGSPVKNKNQARVLHVVSKTNISSPKTFKPNPPSTTPKAIKKTTPPPHESESDECEYTDDENDVIVNTKHSVIKNIPSKIKHVNHSLSKSTTLPMLPEPRGIFKTLFDPSQMSDLSDVEDSEESEKCKNQARVLHVVAQTNDRSSKAFQLYPPSTTAKAMNHIPTTTLDKSESGECEYSEVENEIFVKTKNFIINNISSTIEPVNQNLSHSTTLPRPVEPCVTFKRLFDPALMSDLSDVEDSV